MNRRNFIRTSALGIGVGSFSLRSLAAALPSKSSARQPTAFIGHGGPGNAVKDTEFTRSLRRMGERYERPAAVLVISAHWLTYSETCVSLSPKPETMYDWGGYDPVLNNLKYPAPGAPGKAQELVTNVTSLKIHEDHEYGLDHGAWVILKHIWPQADVPVFQLSIDFAEPPSFHYELGRELRALRRRGVLILGSGNIVHNLHPDLRGPKPHDWALEFDSWVKERLISRNHADLVNYQDKAGEAGLLGAPPEAPDHYLAMLYTLGLMEDDEAVNFTHESMSGSTISMRCFEGVTA